MADTPSNPDELRDAVRARYAAAASAVTAANPTRAESLLSMLNVGECCGATADASAITRDLYAVDEIADLPSTAVLASLGCGNPTALAELKPGETVLDLDRKSVV